MTASSTSLCPAVVVRRWTPRDLSYFPRLVLEQARLMTTGWVGVRVFFLLDNFELGGKTFPLPLLPFSSLPSWPLLLHQVEAKYVCIIGWALRTVKRVSTAYSLWFWDLRYLKSWPPKRSSLTAHPCSTSASGSCTLMGERKLSRVSSGSYRSVDADIWLTSVLHVLVHRSSHPLPCLPT